MIIVGEKINGSIPSMGKAIAEKNEKRIKSTAKKEAASGADYIDCCASVNEGEVETLGWMIDLIQEVTDTPICIDSPNPNAIVEVIDKCKKPGMINSVSGEGNKIDVIFPVIANTPWKVVALLCDDSGIPKNAADRIRVLNNIMAEADKYGIAHDRIFIDPMVEMLCTAEDGIAVLLEVMAYIKENYPKLHIICAVSNISFNLPYRKIINQAFTVMAMNAGMDAAVMDPLNRDLRGAIYATEALKGDDYYCMEYIGAFREGIFGPTDEEK